jgi:hypothetical protein
VLSEYKRRYQRSEQQANDAQRDVAEALCLRGFPKSQAAPAPSDGAPAGNADASGVFQNPFTDKEKERN